MQDEKTVSHADQPAPPKRRRRWPLVLVILVIVVLTGARILWYQAGGKLRSTEPYQAAWALVEKDPQVIAQLGGSVSEVWLPPSGSVFGESAQLTFKIQGPKGRAAVQADARKIGGKWALRVVNVTFDDQKRISLNTSAEVGGDGDAPKWPPAGKPASQDTPASTMIAPPHSPTGVTAAPKAADPTASASTSPAPDIQLDMPDLNSPAQPPAKK